MDCCKSRASCATLLVASLFAIAASQAGEPIPSAHAADSKAAVHDVHGGDFPLLTQATGVAVTLDLQGLPQVPGCEALRARRPQEIPAPWTTAVRSIVLECEADDEASSRPVIAISVTALLKPGRVRMAGFDVSEIRLMDSAGWGDHQYVIAQPFTAIAQPMQTLLRNRCAQQASAHPSAADAPADCAVFANAQGLYLPAGPGNGTWVYPDPDNPAASIYAESWAD